MLYRFAMIGIVAFWMVMMGMLVRLETHPERTDILDVPVSYVARIMFKHGQQSVLAVREEEKPIGSVEFRPLITGSGGRSFDFSGTLSVQWPPGWPPRQRFNFQGAVDMDSALRMLGFHLEVTSQQQHCHVSLKGDVARKTLAFEVRQGDRLTMSQILPMDAASVGSALLQQMGLDAATLPDIAAGGVSPPTLAARETQITMHGEQLEVYQVTVLEGTAAVADIYVTQLGQIVLAKTSFGYRLSAEDYE